MKVMQVLMGSRDVGARYLLNSAVITGPGLYRYRLIDVDEARRWLDRGAWRSTIAYAETAAALGVLTGLEIPTDRTAVRLEPGDEALVFRLVLPPGQRRVEPIAKGQLGVEYVLSHCEIGILARLKEPE